ncbi:MAG TPA: nuclear transport factor 2 family protein [bacterium]|nr:nuclear transport factor 2 family protein [bacterium]
MSERESSDPRKVVHRWTRAMTDHNLDAAVACFAADYHDVTPTRPGQEFRGQDHVRKNFVALFEAVPDLTADLIRVAADGDIVWMEWRMHGARVDGSRFEFAGVNIFGVRDDQFVWGRIYTHPVSEQGNIEAQVARMTTGSSDPKQRRGRA